jgi:hypothetical protein
VRWCAAAVQILDLFARIFAYSFDGFWNQPNDVFRETHNRFDFYVVCMAVAAYGGSRYINPRWLPRREGVHL